MLETGAKRGKMRNPFKKYGHFPQGNDDFRFKEGEYIEAIFKFPNGKKFFCFMGKQAYEYFLPMIEKMGYNK
jgi:hypothetical protein